MSAPRQRRPRGLTEKLLVIVHTLELITLFFAALAAWGVTRDPAAFIWFGIVAVLLVVTVPLLQRPWGWIASGVVQLAYLALGLVIGMMFLVAAVFIVMWIWCVTRGRAADAGPARSAR